MQQTEIDFKARADLGIERSARRAERTEPGWIDRAVEAVREAVKHPLFGTMSGPGLRVDFTIEEVRDWIRNDIPAPPDGRAWGAVTRRAVQLGIIERVAGQYRPAVSSNGSPKPVYRKGRAA